MASTVIPLMQGGDYQSRFFWLQACKLFQPSAQVCRVAFELDTVKSFDDVGTFYGPTVLDEGGRPVHADYFQIKFHVDHAGAFTWKALHDPAFISASSVSLLQRLHQAASVLAPEGTGCRFHIIAPWAIQPDDLLAKLVSNNNGELRLPLLFDGKTRSDMAQIRKTWREHLGLTTDEELERVLRTLRIQTQTGTLEGLRDRLDGQLVAVGLRPIGGGRQSYPYDDLIRKLRAAGRSEFARADMEEICRREGLWLESRPSFSGVAGDGLSEGVNADVTSIKQTVESIDEQLRQHYSRVHTPGAKESPSGSPPASAVGAVPAAGQSPQVKVLMARLGVLEERERQFLDEKGRGLWESIQRSIRELNLRQAVAAGTQLATWLDDEGRRASRSVRGRAALLLADLSVIDHSLRRGDDLVDTGTARQWYRRATEEFTADISAEDAGRLLGLDAKLRFLEGSPDEARRSLEGAEDPGCLNVQLSIALERRDWLRAVGLVEGKPLHERWCEGAVAAYVLHGDSERARQALAWAASQADPATSTRCLLAFAQSTLRRLLAAHPTAESVFSTTFSEEEKATLGETLSTILPLLTLAETGGRVRRGTEAEALTLAVVVTRLLGDTASCGKFATLLGTADPVPVEFARAALRGDIVTPADLPGRLRRNHPELLDAHCLAALLEAERLGKRTEGLEAAIASAGLATTLRQREHFCSTLLEIATPAGEEAVGRAEEVTVRLLGESHALVSFLRAVRHLLGGRTEEAVSLVEACRSEGNPLWLQLSASLKLLQKNETGALDDLVQASRLLPREEVLERTIVLAQKLGRDDVAEEKLRRLVSVSPRSPRAWAQLATTSVRLGKHAQAAECFHRLGELTPSEAAFGVNEAKALALAGCREESLRVFDVVCQRHPHLLEALGARSLLLEAMGKPDRAFQSLEPARDHFWSDHDFLLLYLSLGYKAKREQEAHLAFQRLLELQREGQDVPLKAFTLEEMQDLFRQRHQERETRNRDLLAGRVPWLLVGRMLGRPPSADWACRTQEIMVPDDPQSRAEFTIYATNGWAVLQEGPDQRTLEAITGCPPAGQTVVADLTALLTLHRLDLLAHAAAYFGKILIPAGYGRLAIEDQARLQPHQPSVPDALREIRDAADAGKLPPPPQPGGAGGAGPALLDEHEDEDHACYRLVDLVNWLHQLGRIDEEGFAAFQRISHAPSAEGLPSVGQVVAAGFVTTALTLRIAATAGLFPTLVKYVRLYLPTQEIDTVREDLRAAMWRDEVSEWHRELWEKVLEDPRFEQVEPRQPASPAKGEDTDPLLSAPLLAGERGLPLLADDRCFQAILRTGRPADPNAAFGTDCLLEALAEAGRISQEDLAHHFLQLVRWRYRFLVPPVAALATLAAQHRTHPPGEPLREVSRYVHDCMRDPGLLAGLEPTTPPTSVAWKMRQHWVQDVARFLVRVWHDARFDDAAATAVTRWAVAELLPSPPRSLPRLGAIVACSTTADQVISTAFTDVWQYRKIDRSNVAVRAIADALGLSHEEYLDIVAALLEADISLPATEESEQDVRRAQQLLAYTAVSHVTRFNARSYFTLRRLGVLRDADWAPSEDQLAAVADPAHPSRVESAPGPFVFLWHPDSPNEGQAISIPEFLLAPDRTVRDAAVHFFLQAPPDAGTWLSPRSRTAITEYADAVRSEDERQWFPAAHRLYEILEEDFLLNLAGFRQARQTHLAGEQDASWGKVLRPGLTLFASVPAEWYDLPAQSAASSLSESILDGAASLSDALDRYHTRFGHLPLCPPHSAGTVVRRWVEFRGDAKAVWEQVWAWARSRRSPLPRYHACQIFLECPHLIPEGKTEELWSECAVILRFGRSDADPAEPAGTAWRVLSTLARHYLGQLELHTIDQSPNRLAALAWWTAERVMTAVTESIQAEEAEDERVTGRLHALLERGILPVADLTDDMWSLLHPGAAASSFGYGTMEVRCLWGFALLAAGSRQDWTADDALPEAHETDVAFALLGACLTGFPFSAPQTPQPLLAFDLPLPQTARRWLERIRSDEHRAFPEAMLEERRRLEDPSALVASLRGLTEASSVEQILRCHTFRAACALRIADANAVWALLSDQDWTCPCFSTLDIHLLHILGWGLLELQRCEGGRWHWGLPHFFASLAETPEVEAERRRVLCLMAVRSCVIGGTVSAIHRLLAGARSHEVLPLLGQWKQQLEEARKIAPPVVSAFLRDILSSLPPAPSAAAHDPPEPSET